jgi:hypothetical protein
MISKSYQMNSYNFVVKMTYLSDIKMTYLSDIKMMSNEPIEILM